MAPLNPKVPLTLIQGDSSFLVDREARAFTESLLAPREQAYALTVADLSVTPVPDALGLLAIGSLMAPRRVILLRNLQAVAASSTGKTEGESSAGAPGEALPKRRSLSGGGQKALAAVLADLPPNVFVILTHVSTRERKGYAIGAALSRLLSEKGQTLRVMTPDDKELVRWAIREAEAEGKNLEPRAAELLVSLTGRDCSTIASEVAKLCTYVGKAQKISSRDVLAVVVRSVEATSFQLVDAIAEGKADKALALLSELVPSHNAATAAIPLVGMIARNIRLLWQASFLARQGFPIDRQRPSSALADLLPSEQNVAEAARTGFVARKLAAHARNFTDAQAAVCLELVLHADRALKGQTGEQLDPRLVVERLVTKLCLITRG